MYLERLKAFKIMPFNFKLYSKRKRLSICYLNQTSLYLYFFFIGPLGKNKYKIAKKGIYILNSNPLKLFFTKEMLKSFVSVLKHKIIGVTRGYYISLMLRGLGYRLKKKKFISTLRLKLGYKHFYLYKFPVFAQIFVIKYKLLIFLNEKELLRRIVNEIRALRLPDPYKGKGVRYKNEPLILKPGKQR